MTKEEAKAKLRKAESDLRQANIVLEMHEQGVAEIRDEIDRLQAIINKPDRWQDGLVQPDKGKYYYLTSSLDMGLTVDVGGASDRKPEHAFKTEEQAELIKEKMLLMQEMYAFAHVRNEGWMPDWGDEDWVPDWKDENQKWGLSYDAWGILQIYVNTWCNDFVFGIAVKNREIAEEMLEEFGERIEKVYNKQY